MQGTKPQIRKQAGKSANSMSALKRGSMPIQARFNLSRAMLLAEHPQSKWSMDSSVKPHLLQVQLWILPACARRTRDHKALAKNRLCLVSFVPSSPHHGLVLSHGQDRCQSRLTINATVSTVKARSKGTLRPPPESPECISQFAFGQGAYPMRFE